MRILVVYYSYGGTTRKLAEALAKTLGADLAEVRCPRYGRGTMSFLAACYDSLTARLPAIDAPPAHTQNYDLVIIGSPIWTGHAATPIRKYLSERQGQFKRVALFLTCGGSAPQAAFAEMSQIAGAQPEATLTLRTADVLGKGLAAAVEAFAQPFKAKAAA
jgi:flavodoxin